MNKILIIAIASIILFSGCINLNQHNANKKNNKNLESNSLREVELSLKGLSCDSCVYAIKSVMNETQGIKESEIKITDYAKQTGTARITYDPKQITKEKIMELTKPYPSKIIKDFSLK